MNPLYVHLPLPQHQFSLFYSLAFIIALTLLLYEGYRRKFPVIPWILIISFSQILFIIGTKLFALSHEEWDTMFHNFTLVPAAKKELFGGMVMLGFGLWIGKVWMKFKPSFLDAFALVLPLSLAFQKTGCFFAGCCFGKPSTLSWAVQYPAYTLPHYHHFQQATIGQGDLFSLPVHPVQLYELFGCLVILLLVLGFQKKWKANGSSLLFSLALYLIVRFIVEFFKDPLAHTTGGTLAGALNQTQWGALIVLPLMVAFLVVRETGWKHPVSANPVASAPPLPSILSFLSLSAILITVLSKWFQPVEIATILVFFMLAAFLTLLHILKNYRKLRYKLMYAGLLLLPFILMGQTLPQQVNDSVQIKKSRSVGIGFGSGNYENSSERYIGEGCDRITNSAYFNQKYVLGGASLNFRNENLTNNNETNFGVNLMVGNHTETLLDINISGDTSITAFPRQEPVDQILLGINPYYKFDIRWFGIGAGLHFGKLSHTVYGKGVEGYGTPKSGRYIVSVFPQAYLRIGPRDIAYIDYHFADHFPSALPAYKHMLGIGTGFGSTSGISLRMGTLIGNSHYTEWLDFWGTSLYGLYLTGYFPLTKGFILEPLMLFNNSEYNDKMDFNFSFGLHYAWGNKVIKRPVIPYK